VDDWVHGDDDDGGGNTTTNTATTITPSPPTTTTRIPWQHYPEQHKKRLADKLNVKVCCVAATSHRQFQLGVA